MRPLRIDITGKTDVNGNASIPVKLPQTGEWHNVKVALSTSGPAEWALQLSGSAVTYGRGRRVTLGPELVQDGETLTVTVTGGPVSAAIVGTASGVSGSPTEITNTFTPQPNTIALDTSFFRTQLAGSPFTAPTNATTSKSFVLPTNATDLRILLSGALVVPTILQVTGGTTGTQYFDGSAANFLVDAAMPITVPVDPEVDSSVTVLLILSANQATLTVYVIAISGTEAVEVYNQLPLGVTFGRGATPAPWQQPNKTAVINGSAFGNGVTLHPIAGVVGQIIYIFDYRFVWDAANTCAALMQSTSADRVDSGFNTGIGTIALQGNGNGRQLPSSDGLDIVQQAANAGNLWGHVHYTQQ